MSGITLPKPIKMPPCASCGGTERKLHARGLCRPCWNKAPRESQISRSSRPERRYRKPKDPATSDDSHPSPKEFSESVPSGTATPLLQKRVLDMAERFLYNPKRVGAALQQYYVKAFGNDKILLDYLDRVLPKKGAAPTVAIQINTPLLEKPAVEGAKVYDVTGEEVTQESDAKKDV